MPDAVNDVRSRHEKLAQESGVKFMALISGADFWSVCQGPKVCGMYRSLRRPLIFLCVVDCCLVVVEERYEPVMWAVCCLCVSEVLSSTVASSAADWQPLCFIRLTVQLLPGQLCETSAACSISLSDCFEDVTLGNYTVSQKRAHLYTLCNFVKS